ncbi:YdcF family protein [Natronosalvus vescus]|uniref:YdcF family protein n=1 Tax=Natronosalvus vescus TaxID=2953881 RepID=UPI00209120D3|nr:YdcF family protein [Natronosalvus vescus]
MVVVTLGRQLQSKSDIDELHDRVDVGVSVFRRTDAQYLIFSGGRTNQVLPRSESAEMEAYGLEAGIDPDRIRLENRSLDTIGNGYFSRRLIDGLPTAVDTVYLVTSAYHLERATYVFDQCVGDRYDVVPVEAGPGRQERRRAERQRLRRTRAFFDGVSSGDVETIARRLQERHDYYDELSVAHA